MMLEMKETASWHPALQWFVVSTYHLWASTVCTFLCAQVCLAHAGSNIVHFASCTMQK